MTNLDPYLFFFFSSRRRHTRCSRDWSSDVCSSDLRGREEDQKLIVFADLDCLLPIDFVRRCIEQPAPGDHSRRVRQPNRVPVGFNLARGRPARTRTAVEVFKTWRIQKQGLHYIWHSSPSALFTNLAVSNHSLRCLS